MADDLVVRLSGDEAKLVAAYQKAVAAAGKLTKPIDESVKAAKKADKEIVQFANHVKEIQVTPLERYKQATDKLQAAQAKGLLTQQQVIQHQKQLKEELDKTQNKGNSVAEGIVSGAQSMAMQYVGFTAVLGGVNRAFTEMEERAGKAVAEADKLISPRNALTQISATGEDLAKYEQAADKVSSITGLERGRSRNLQFTLASAGLGDRQDLAAKLAIGDTIGLNTETGSSLVTDLPKMTGGKLSEEQAVNFGLAVALNAKKDISQIQPEISKAFEQAQRTGALPEEIGSLISKASFTMLNPGQRVGALEAKIAQHDELRKLTLAGAMERLKGDEGLRQEVLGDSMEANAMYEFAANNWQGSDSKVIADATYSGDAWQNLLQVGGTPQARARIQRQAAEQQAAINNEQAYAMPKDARTQAEANLESVMDKQGTWSVNRWRLQAENWINTRLYGSDPTIEARDLIAERLGDAAVKLYDAAVMQQRSADELIRGSANHAAQAKAQANQARE